MTKMIFDEWYGELTGAQQAAYRKFNVSPSAHDELTHVFGEGDHDRITRFVKSHSSSGRYRKPWPLSELLESRITGEILTEDEVYDRSEEADPLASWVPLRELV